MFSFYTFEKWLYSFFYTLYYADFLDIRCITGNFICLVLSLTLFKLWGLPWMANSWGQLNNVFRPLPHLNSKTCPCLFFGPPTLDFDVDIFLRCHAKCMYLFYIKCFSPPKRHLRLDSACVTAQPLGVPFSKWMEPLGILQHGGSISGLCIVLTNSAWSNLWCCSFQPTPFCISPAPLPRLTTYFQRLRFFLVLLRVTGILYNKIN